MNIKYCIPRLNPFNINNSLVVSKRHCSISTTNTKELHLHCDKCKTPYNFLIERPLTKSRDQIQLKKCREIQAPNFKTSNNNSTVCAINNLFSKVGPHVLSKHKDVLDISKNPSRPTRVFMGILNDEREKDHADLTGDHGVILGPFLKKAFHSMKIDPLVVENLVDIGGQDQSTVKFVQEILSLQGVRSLIIDVNILTPLVNSADSSIAYIIADSLDVFDENSQCFNKLKNYLSSGPKMFILNNLTNVIGSEKSWENIEAIWKQMQPGDFMAIGGLSDKQFSNPKDSHRYNLDSEKDGIIDVKSSGNFFKSALSDAFPKKLKTKFLLENEHIFSSEGSAPMKGRVASKAMEERLVLIRKPGSLDSPSKVL